MTNGSAGRLDHGHGPQRNHLALVVADLQAPHVLGLHAEGRVGLGVHLPGAAELVEIVHVQSAQIDLQGVEDVVHGDAHRLALGAVDVDIQLRRVGAKDGEQADQARLLISGLNQLVGLLLQHVQPFVAAVFDHDFEAAGVAQAAHGRRAEDGHVGLLNLLVEAVAKRLRDGVGGQIGRLPLFERIENDEHRPQVRTVRPQHEGQARDADGMGDALGLAGDFAGHGRDLFRARQRGRVGQLNRRQQVALVLLGNEAQRHLPETPNGQIQQARRRPAAPARSRAAACRRSRYSRRSTAKTSC